MAWFLHRYPYAEAHTNFYSPIMRGTTIMQTSKIGLVLFNDKFEDGSLPIPSLSPLLSSPSTSPRSPLAPPLSKLGKVPFFSLLHGRGEKMRIHLASFIKKPKVKKLKKLKLPNLKTDDKKKRRQNGSLQKKILECKTPQEIETLLIHEGVLKIDF